MLDASRICYLKQINELENQDFQPLKTDPALFVYKHKAHTMCEAVGAVYAKDLIVASKENTVENSQYEIQEHRATNPRDDLPGPRSL